MVLAAFLVVPFGQSFLVQANPVTGLGGSAPAAGTVHSEYGTKTGPEPSKEEWMDGVEKTLQSIKATSEKDETRGYYNKMVSRELIRHVRVIVIILAIMAVAFPLAIWLMSRKRLLGLSGLSTEVAATLLVIEERQAKLANTLKEIQDEIDYLHTMSVPELNNLIQQAESYLKQNQADLEKAGSVRRKPQGKP